MLRAHATAEVAALHVACPECGTGYTLKPEALERERLKLRCHRCGHVWDPRRPTAEEGEPPLAREEPPAAGLDRALVRAPAEDEETATPPPPPRRRRGTARVLAALTVVLLLVGASGLGYAYRDVISADGAPRAALSDVRPVWRDDDVGRRLVVAATVRNPGAGVTAVDRVRVKFLSGQGAWLAERIVEVDKLVVAPGAEGELEVALESLPEGTASLELSVAGTPRS